MNNFKEKANFLWSIADLLRGHYKQADYGKVILPLTVLRRLDFVLEPTKKDVLAAYEKHKDKKAEVLEPILNTVAKAKFHNRSKYDFYELAKDSNNVAANLRNYINGYSISAKEIIDYFSFEDQIKRLDEYDLLYMIIKKFAEAGDMFKDVSTLEMGYIFEELIRKFAELSNETAGEHFTPREVIRLMVNLLFVNDKDILRRKGIVKTLYDPACGTGGMLSVAEEYLQELNPDAKLEVFGQELNPESYAICKSDMLIKGQNPSNIKFGNTFTQDGLEDETFDYMLSNPPFGVEWKNAEKQIRSEFENKGFAGRFGAGLPLVSDGSLLFLQHMISKMKRSTGGSRIGIVFNGSPLFSGGAGSGSSDIRKWIIENDMLEAVIAMPDQLFYNTGITTYIWIVTDRKSKERIGKVQLVNSTGNEWLEGDKNNPFYIKMQRSLGSKRKEIGDGKDAKPDHISFITNIYGDFKQREYCKILDNDDFGYYRITIERPKKNTKGEIELDRKGNPIPDADLRDTENVPLKENIENYFKREILPNTPDAWIDHGKTKIGYEINFTKHFYQPKSFRSLVDIGKEILSLEKETVGMIKSTINSQELSEIINNKINENFKEWEWHPIKRGIQLLTDYDANGSFSTIKDNVNRTNDVNNRYAWLVRATDLENSTHEIDLDELIWVDKETYDFLSKSYLTEDDLLIAKRGEIGKVYVMPKFSYPATLGPNMYLVRLNKEKLNSKFLYFFFQSSYGKSQLIINNKSTTIGALYKDDFKSIIVPYPPLKEQYRIVEAIENEIYNINNTIAKIEEQVELLNEYKTALISEVVTNKINK